MRTKSFQSTFSLPAIALSTLFLAACGAGSVPDTIVPAAAAPALFACGGPTFTSPLFTAGTINGQSGWFSDPASRFDEAIVDLGIGACRGKGVWKIGNAVTSTAFSNQPQSPSLQLTAGESAVRSIGGGDTMEVSFFIRTVSAAGADGSAFTFSLSPGTADRHNYLRFVNDDNADGGFQAVAIDGVNLDQNHIVKNNIGRGQWHHIRIRNRNVDGLNGDGSGNDIVEAYFDGVLVSTHTTWEAWRAALPATTLAVNRSLFRLAAAASSFGAFATPLGFYIDDYTQTITNSSNPGVILAEYKTGFEVP